MEYFKLADSIQRVIERSPLDRAPYSDLFSCCRSWEQEDSIAAHTVSRWLRERSQSALAACNPKDAEFFFDLYKRTLLFDAPHDFDSFLLYMEINRKPDKKFYAPRRHYLKPIVQGYQDVLDGKLRLLTVSLPKRAGKLIARDTPVLTTMGFKKHGELQPGDYVYGIDGKPVKVLYKHPDSYAVYRVKFSSGEEILTSAEHEWPVRVDEQPYDIMLETGQMYRDGGFRSFKVPMLYSLNPVTHKTVVVENIEPLEEPVIGNCITVEGGLYAVGKSLTITHNSQLGINFINLLSGRRPDRASLMEGTGDGLVNSFYKGCLEYLQEPNEYLFYDVFPNARIVQTNADNKTINLESKSRFPTIMCRSIDARQVGLSEATNVLYLDDCVEGREEAKNRQRLEDKWEVISGDIMGRAIEGTPMVFTGTRYSIYDPIGKVQDYAKSQNWSWRAIEIPALDPETDESNYEYVREGKKVFTTAYFREQRDLLSQEQFESEFQQQPFEARGLLFPKDDLNYYYELPPDRTPDAVVAFADTAESGSDYVSMPVGYIYGDDVMIEDVVFDDSPADVTKPQCANLLFKHKVQIAVFESNNAGEYYAKDVADILKRRGGRCSIRTRRTASNKQTRIEFAADGIKKNFWFKHPSTYDRRSQYAEFMKQVTTHTRTGKVAHDDAPDSLAMMENGIRNIRGGGIEVLKRPV